MDQTETITDGMTPTGSVTTRPTGHEAFDAEGKSLGIFPTKAEARKAVYLKHKERNP